jgi:hypothetical protein
VLTDEQIKARLGKITSSVAAACMGYNPSFSPKQAWEDIMGLRTFKGSKATEFGDLAEPGLLKWAVEKTGCINPIFNPSMRSKNYWSGSHADMVAECPVTGEVLVFDAKTAGPQKSLQFGKEFTDEVPWPYFLQCQWHLYHYEEAQICYLPAGIVRYTLEPNLYIIYRDNELIEEMETKLFAFYEEYVETGVCPKVRKENDVWILV